MQVFMGKAQCQSLNKKNEETSGCAFFCENSLLRNPVIIQEKLQKFVFQMGAKAKKGKKKV
jgi:hypothetical protein